MLSCPEKHVSCIPSCNTTNVRLMADVTTQRQCASMYLSTLSILNCKESVIQYFKLVVHTVWEMRFIIFADRCRRDNHCSYWTFEENLERTEERRCTLMSTCEKTRVAPSPILTSSGSKDCIPEADKRRKCIPGCPEERPYCHGRYIINDILYYGLLKVIKHPVECTAQVIIYNDI